MDKILLKFFADVMYLQGMFCWEEYEDIMECRLPADLDRIFEKMLKEEYNGYNTGKGFAEPKVIR